MDKEACAMCDSEDELVEDPNMEGVFHCSVCLARVKQQDDSIAEGMDDEPPVEY